MSSEDRLPTIAQSFLAEPLKCGKIILRPLTAGSLLLLQSTGNALFGEVGRELTEEETLQCFLQYIWIHTADMKQVLASSRDRTICQDGAMELGFEIGTDDLAEFSAGFGELLERANLTQAEAVPERSEGKPPSPAPSPTGSPASSLTWAEREIQKGKPTSSGDSPSTAPSSTSTPPCATTEADAAGPPPEPASAAPALQPLLVPESASAPVMPLSERLLGLAKEIYLEDPPMFRPPSEEN